MSFLCVKNVTSTIIARAGQMKRPEDRTAKKRGWAPRRSYGRQKKGVAPQQGFKSPLLQPLAVDSIVLKPTG